MVLAAVGLAAIAITTQVSRHDGEAFSQLIGDFVPDHMGLRVAVQQEQGRTGAALPIVDPNAIDLALATLELLEHGTAPEMGALSLGVPEAIATGSRP